MKHLLVIAGFVSAGVQAEESVPRQTELPLWEVGAVGGGVVQQAYPGSDEQARRALALPYLVYRGKLLRADGDGAGLRAVRTDGFELDVSFSGSLSSGAESLRAREGMARLGTLLEAGPVARWFLNGREARDRISFELPWRGVFEARDPSRHRGMSFEPKVAWQHRAGASGWGYGLSATALFGDRRLGSTFYGIAPNEARSGRPAYVARGGLIAWRLNASAVTSLTPDLRLFIFGRVESVAGAVNRDSALVRQTTGASYGIGLNYTLVRSAARSGD